MSRFVMTSLADAVLPLIRTRADLSRRGAATAHGSEMHCGRCARGGARTTDTVEFHAVAHAALASAVKEIARADDSSGIIGDACRPLLDMHPQADTADDTQLGHLRTRIVRSETRSKRRVADVARQRSPCTTADALVRWTHAHGARRLFDQSALAAQAAVAIIGLVATTRVLAEGETDVSARPEQVPVILLLGLAAVFVHEYGHAIVTVHYGGGFSLPGFGCTWDPRCSTSTPPTHSCCIGDNGWSRPRRDRGRSGSPDPSSRDCQRLGGSEGVGGWQAAGA